MIITKGFGGNAIVTKGYGHSMRRSLGIAAYVFYRLAKKVFVKKWQ